MLRYSRCNQNRDQLSLENIYIQIEIEVGLCLCMDYLPLLHSILIIFYRN